VYDYRAREKKITTEWNKVISPVPSPPGINYQSYVFKEIQILF